mgnify:CR=1 FL=1
MTSSDKGTVTDIHGNYLLELPVGEHQLRVSYLGFQTIRRKILVEVGKTLELSLELKEKSNQLDVYVVSASNYKKEMLVENISMDLLDAEMIQNKQEPTMSFLWRTKVHPSLVSVSMMKMEMLMLATLQQHYVHADNRAQSVGRVNTNRDGRPFPPACFAMRALSSLT